MTWLHLRALFTDSQRQKGLFLRAAMVPGSFEFVEAFPLTSSGKIDRIALQQSTLPMYYL